MIFENPFVAGFSALPMITGGKSRAVNAENPRGEKGRGGMASSGLGPSRKGSPCLGEIKPGETATLAEIDGPGVIQHIWITVTDKPVMQTVLSCVTWYCGCTGTEKRHPRWRVRWATFSAVASGGDAW